MTRKYQAFIFDAYGTLFDVHSVVMRSGVAIPGDLDALSRLWRQKQLEFTWLRALMDRYQDFWQVTEAALRTAVAQLHIEAPEPQLQQLLQAYLTPSAFEDARIVLEALSDFPRAILSNGSPMMLEAAVRHNGFEPYFVSVISVDQLKTYKPSPLVYELGPEVLQLPAKDILFVSSNGWDAAGAKAFGYSVCWCNRSGQTLDRLGFEPDIIVSSLDQIPGQL